MHLRTRLIVATPPRNPIEPSESGLNPTRRSVGGLVNPDEKKIRIAIFGVRSADAINSGLKC